MMKYRGSTKGVEMRTIDVDPTNPSTQKRVHVRPKSAERNDGVGFYINNPPGMTGVFTRTERTNLP